MSDRATGATSIGKQAKSLTVSPQFSGYTKVIINLTENMYLEAGSDLGSTLEFDCPWATQQMAEDILSSVSGYQYQPFSASKAILDPAAELGDGLTVNGVYGGIFKMDIKAGPLYAVDVSAPGQQEVEHEYKFTPKADRKIQRRLADMQSELSIQADQIAAKVDETGGDTSFGWELMSTGFKLKSNGSDVMTVDSTGLTVNGNGTFTGEVQAKNIQYGGNAGTFSGSGLTGRSIGTAKVSSGINTSLGNADDAADIFAGSSTAKWLKANNVMVQAGGTLNVVGSAKIKYGNNYAAWVSKVVKDENGNNITIHYLGF